jgi:uncharacterized membrane protein (DUF2068 family)
LSDVRAGPSPAPPERGDRLVGVIGVFKLMKSAVLGVLGVSGLLGLPERFVRPALRALQWTGAMSGHHAVRGAIVKLLSTSDQALRDLSIAGLCYAAVFAVEGVGLIRRRRWAEWLTVAVTASFMPLEIYELVRHPGAGKVVALAINAAIVAYLVGRRLAVSSRHGT